MASSMRLASSNLITRSTFLSTASRFLNIYGHQSYTTVPKNDFNEQSPIRIMYPKISSMSFDMRMTDKWRSLTLKIPDGGLSVELDKPGLKKKDMRVCAEQNTWFIQDIADKTGSDIKEDDFKSSNIILNNMANNIIASFCDITAKHSWSYYDMFSDQSILGKGLCRVIAMSSPINSFSIHKEETAELLVIEMSMPGNEEIKVTTQGVRVSLNMNGVDREDVTVFFDYDTLFIEGKNKKHHYITGIHLPKGIHMKNNVIKREKEGDVFYAFLACSGKKEELLELLEPKTSHSGILRHVTLSQLFQIMQK